MPDGASQSTLVAELAAALARDPTLELESFLDGRLPPPRELALLIDIDMQAAWKLGDQRTVLRYSQTFTEIRADRDALLDLIYAEVLLREEHGQCVDWGAYTAAFPELRESLARQEQLHRVIEVAADEASGAADQWTKRGGFPEDDSAAKLPPELGGFELLEVCGRGAIAIVYKARDCNLNREVAIKMLARELMADAPEVARMRREAEVAASLDHPAIVRIHGVRADPRGLPLIVMEYVDGGNLADLLLRGRLPIGRAVSLLRQISEGVAAAHAAGLVHRDLKPANILLTRSGDAKVTDFGLVRIGRTLSGRMTADRATATGAFVGTPAYMAPEQARGQQSRIAPTADVYSLGVVLFEMLAGRPPFQAASSWDLIHDLIHTDAPPLRRLNSRVPRELEAICGKCLSKMPGQRYASAGELAADLERFATGRPVLAKPERLWSRAVRWCRRNPRVAALLLVSLSLLVTLAIGSSVAAVSLNSANNAIRRERERARAAETLAVQDRQAAVASLYEVVKSLYDDLAANTGTIKAREKVVQAALDGLRRIADLGDDRTIVLAHQRIGDLLSIQGKVSAAEKEYLLSLEMARRLVQRKPRDIEARLDLAGAEDVLAIFYHTHGGIENAGRHHHAAHHILLDLAREIPTSREVLVRLVTSFQRQIDNLWAGGRTYESISVGLAAKPYLVRLLSLGEVDRRTHQVAVGIYQRLSRSYQLAGQIPAAAEAVVEANRHMEAAVALDPDNSATRRTLQLNRRYQASIESLLGNTNRAIELYDLARKELKQLADEDVDDLVRLRDYADSCILEYGAVHQAGDFLRAERLARWAIDAYSQLIAKSPESLQFRVLSAQAYLPLFRCQIRRRAWSELAQSAQEARETVLAPVDLSSIPDAVAASDLHMLAGACEAALRNVGQWDSDTHDDATMALLSWYAYVDALDGHVTKLSAETKEHLKAMAEYESIDSIDALFAAALRLEVTNPRVRESAELTEILALAQRAKHATHGAHCPPRIRQDLLSRTFAKLGSLRGKAPGTFAYVTRIDPDLRWFCETDEFKRWLHECP